MKTQDIEYSDGTVNMRGFLAYDDTVRDKRPGILVAPEAWGLGEHAMQRARMLAELGYVAFAVDTYGDRRQFTSMQEVMTVVGELMSNPAKMRGRARSALATLAAQTQVDSHRLGAIGFCMGGTIALELARAGEALAAVVSFHGGLDTAAPATANGIRARVLVCTGAEDPMIPAEKVVAFEEEMRKANADWQVITYGHTVHSFTNPAADGSMNPGVKYNKLSDQRSWAAMQAFFKECFI
jgi:dienelactone hydrolase